MSPQKLDTTTFANDMTTFKRKDDVLTLWFISATLGMTSRQSWHLFPMKRFAVSMYLPW